MSPSFVERVEFRGRVISRGFVGGHILSEHLELGLDVRVYRGNIGIARRC